MTEWIVHDGPDDNCFGCGQANASGLRLKFRRVEGGVEAEYIVPDAYNGAPGIVHGGIQATLLDEIMGMTTHVALGHDDGRIATTHMSVRYRRPAATNVPLLIRGRVVKREDPYLFLEAEIVDAEGRVLTEAEARFKRLGDKRT
jgi:uncharacterized protein (TIGR00369 family)